MRILVTGGTGFIGSETVIALIEKGYEVSIVDNLYNSKKEVLNRIKTLTGVMPTFYEIALKTRYLRDDESKEVLDLIIDGRTFDFGYIYDGWAGFSFLLQEMMGKANTNFESEYAMRKSAAMGQYKKVIKAFDKLS